MHGRTFFRIMLDNLFVNNALFESIIKLVKFLKEMEYFNHKNLKTLNKKTKNVIIKEDDYKNKFKFNSITSNRTG